MCKKARFFLCRQRTEMIHHRRRHCSRFQHDEGISCTRYCFLFSNPIIVGLINNIPGMLSGISEHILGVVPPTGPAPAWSHAMLRSPCSRLEPSSYAKPVIRGRAFPTRQTFDPIRIFSTKVTVLRAVRICRLCRPLLSG